MTAPRTGSIYCVLLVRQTNQLLCYYILHVQAVKDTRLQSIKPTYAAKARPLCITNDSWLSGFYPRLAVSLHCIPVSLTDSTDFTPFLPEAPHIARDLR